MLDWRNPLEVRKQGVDLANEIEDLSLLIMPPAPVSVWECCAEIISRKSDLVLEPYLSSLIEWIEDTNWPGALIILERLKVFSGEKLKQPFVERYDYAVNLNNEEGLSIIDGISELLDNEELKAKLPNDMVEVLQKHYKNWYWWDVES